MGLHSGYLVATTSPAKLLEELSRHAGEFIPDVVVDRTSEAEIDSSQFDLLLGGSDDRAFLLDTSMILSDSPDMIVAMSAELGTVVGAGAETVSGTYWLTVARDGEPLRYVYASHASLTQGMAMGDPLPSEEECPLVDISGQGVFAALALFGLDPSPWLASGPATIVRYDAARFPADGPIAAVVAEHAKQHSRPEGEWLREITVVSTEGGVRG
ncbi:hypothetical protein ACFP2T_07505 [Plantactinospora solaniradicis]|uniref:Uncharacterized protein n=1 Tax=Plantactinospora solaniradicis TaxID=1723736 RepID=A0ABW1K2T6_9ACTN